MTEQPRSGLFAPYRVEEGPLDYDQILGWSREVDVAYDAQGLSNPLSVYERVLDVLAGPRFQVRPLRSLMDPGGDDRVRVSLRHDMDGTVTRTNTAAQLLQERGIEGSFYILHTSGYYGAFQDGVFLRHRGMTEVVAGLGASSHEIGLHIDPLHVYLTQGMDGTEAVLTELAWLRGQGVAVNGVVAHNSAPVFGAENFEMLKGLAMDDRRSLVWNGVEAPLQTIDMQAAGLAYEGNYPRQPDEEDRLNLAGFLSVVPANPLGRADWQALYLLHNPVFRRRFDASAWLIGADRWVLAEHGPFKKLFSNVDTKTMLTWLRRLRRGTKATLVIHPEYLSTRD